MRYVHLLNGYKPNSCFALCMEVITPETFTTTNPEEVTCRKCLVAHKLPNRIYEPHEFYTERLVRFRRFGFAGISALSGMQMKLSVDESEDCGTVMYVEKPTLRYAMTVVVKSETDGKICSFLPNCSSHPPDHLGEVIPFISKA